MLRSEDDIERIQKISLDSCIWISQECSIFISTKLHRIMMHAEDHLFQLYVPRE